MGATCGAMDSRAASQQVRAHARQWLTNASCSVATEKCRHTLRDHHVLLTPKHIHTQHTLQLQSRAEQAAQLHCKAYCLHLDGTCCCCCTTTPKQPNSAPMTRQPTLPSTTLCRSRCTRPSQAHRSSYHVLPLTWPHQAASQTTTRHLNAKQHPGPQDKGDRKWHNTAAQHS